MSADQPGGPERYRVLVVDDEPDMVDMVMRMLRGRYHAVGSTTAGEALAMLEEERFDVALVDQRLSDGTGTSVLARCAQRSPLCRRIAMSGQAELGDLLAAINVAKVSRFLLKPFARDHLLEVLGEALAEYEAERAELERMLVARGAQAGERRQVGERRGGRRARGRGRPPHWPASPGVRPVSLEDPSAFRALFDPEVGIVVAALRPEHPLDDQESQAWAAELELRMVTGLRDSDQALRLPDARFVVVFARTSLEGCRRACRRLADSLRGGLLFDLTAWPERGVPGPAELVDRILRG
ncbi:MAG TPA: response regulator [Kofleriaceae bacterium]|nr:response regulator [Kofleriaceae bacterium]